jgi:hypothetical protein
MRVALGGRGDPLGQRPGQGGLRDELPLSRDATSDAAATAQMLCPAPSAKYRRLDKNRSKVSSNHLRPRKKKATKSKACSKPTDLSYASRLLEQ